MPVDERRESWKPGEPWEGALDEIAYIKELARELGGPERIQRQHDGGRLTIRERIDALAKTHALARPVERLRMVSQRPRLTRSLPWTV